jgi:hypothetical protein
MTNQKSQQRFMKPTKGFSRSRPEILYQQNDSIFPLNFLEISCNSQFSWLKQLLSRICVIN